MSGVPYTSVVGSIVYVMICTCPNISHAVNIVDKFMENPSKVHQQIVK
jgi:ATP-binding cassette subfamily B (MDR/TAP) protein 1